MKRHTKNSIFGTFLSMLAVAFLASCSDWTDVENIGLDKADISKDDPQLYTQYLQNLRDYRNSDHTLVYVWFDNSQKTPFSRAHHITDLPDSVDIVGIIHPEDLSGWELEEMNKVRQDKGMKVIYTVDFESMKAAYNAKLELATEEEPIAQDFHAFLTDSLEYSLNLAGKYNYDGICIGYAGKSRLHMRPNELKEYTENERAFINIVTDWHTRNKDKIIVYEGKPQNLIDHSLLDDCLSILISGKDANSQNDLSYKLSLSVEETFPSDRYGMVVMATDLNDPNQIAGYFADRTLAMEGLAEWAPAPHNGIKIKAVGIYNVSTDYFTQMQDYYYTRNLISSVNPSVK